MTTEAKRTVIILLLVAALQVSNTVAQVTVDFNPPSLNMQAGESALVAVELTGVPGPGLAAFQFDLVFNPGPIDILNPNEAYRGTVAPFAPLGGDPLCTTVRGTGTCEDPAWLLTSTGRNPVGTDNIDNVTGLVEVVYGTSGAQVLPTGDGAIALIEVVAMGGGTVTVDLAEVILADNSEPPVPYSLTLGSLTVTIANRAPVLGAIGLQSGEAGMLLGVPLSSSDPDSDGLTLSVAGEPSFCSLVDYGDGTGTLDCSPAYADVGSYSATVTVTDDGTPNLTDDETFAIDVITASTCTDADSDGYGSPGHLSCPAGSSDDCNDANPAISPAASELCRNGVDDDCNDLTDGEEAICASSTCVVIALGAPASDPTLTLQDPATCPVGGVLARTADLIRGDLANLLPTGGEIRLGTVTQVTCASTVEGQLFDPLKPHPASVDVYLARETGQADYGTSTASEPRIPDTGGCP